MSGKKQIDKIREKDSNFLIELNANRRSLRYGVEDRLGRALPIRTETYGPELGHGRIETRTYYIYDGLELIADKKKWGGNLTIITSEYEMVKKSTSRQTSENRLYITSLPVHRPRLGTVVRDYWSIESFHRSLDWNLLQDDIKRKSPLAARNLDTLQRIMHGAVLYLERQAQEKVRQGQGCGRTYEVSGTELHQTDALSIPKMNFFKLILM